MRFAVRFLGCKVSQADAMLARRRLLEAGHVEVAEEDAEVQVINTCCITSEAEAKSRQAVRRALAAGRQAWAGGCAVNLRPAAFAALGPGARAFAGAAEEVARDMAGAAGACADVDADVLARRPESLARTRGFVKVQDGCDSTCAYCIIPTVRGAARSRPAGAVLDEARRRVASGQPELVLTGISVGDYRDAAAGLDLGGLMTAVARLPGVRRVRLSSVEVIHLRPSLLDALAAEPAICPHLHVPLQSGDDGVLAAMGRRYDAAGYLEAVGRLRAAVPEVNLTTDVIVGFPAEDEAAFARTLEVVRAAGITRVHTFPYSARPGTVAADLPDGVGPDERRRRARELRGLSEALSRRHRAGRLGRVHEVLVDKVADDRCSGHTADYTRCYLPGGAGRAGELVMARADELHADGLRCSPAGPSAEGE